MKEIDCRELSCPQPVLQAKKVLEEMREGEFIFIVDNPAARDNVGRFVQSQGCKIDTEERGQDFYLHIKRGREKETETEPQKRERIVVYVNSQFLGVGDDALGSVLMRSFLKTLVDLNPIPSQAIFINSGVKLTSGESEVLRTLAQLSGRGVEILSCGTCLDFYGLKEKLRVGKVSNMFEITESLLTADRLIRP